VIVKITSKNALDPQEKLWNGLLQSACLVYQYKVGCTRNNNSA
jgi:hypothetical protein